MTSVSGAPGPAPGGVNRLSALRRSASMMSAIGFSASARARRSLARSKLKPLVTKPTANRGVDTTNGVTRCAATSRTVHCPHRLGVRHCSSVQPVISSASWRRSLAIMANVSSIGRTVAPVARDAVRPTLARWATQGDTIRSGPWNSVGVSRSSSTSTEPSCTTRCPPRCRGALCRPTPPRCSGRSARGRGSR
jgi:hypothetical protein